MTVVADSGRCQVPPNKTKLTGPVEREVGRQGSLNYLVSAQQQRLRHCEPERPCGPEIDHQLELRRLLDRKIGGLFPAKDAVDVASASQVLLSAESMAKLRG